MDDQTNKDLQLAGEMNDVEHTFAQWLLTAPAEQKEHFRQTLGMLMQCYGDRPKFAILANVIDKTNGMLMVHGINMDASEMHLAATLSLHTINEQLTAANKQSSVH